MDCGYIEKNWVRLLTQVNYSIHIRMYFLYELRFQDPEVYIKGKITKRDAVWSSLEVFSKDQTICR